MSESRRYQRVIPMLVYEDCPAAIEFLCRAFGFVERFRLPMPDGKIGHAELVHDEDVVMLASTFPEMGLVSPQTLPARHSQVQCYVDDVDAHHERALKEGATITAPVEDQFYGDRNYRAVDPEGNRWIFATRVKDIPFEELQLPE